MDEEDYRCDTCDAAFESEEELRRHLWRMGIVE
jgi:uncharacterized hydantoinase/oxoprolinase family protein